MPVKTNKVAKTTSHSLHLPPYRPAELFQQRTSLLFPTISTNERKNVRYPHCIVLPTRISTTTTTTNHTSGGASVIQLRVAQQGRATVKFFSIHEKGRAEEKESRRITLLLLRKYSRRNRYRDVKESHRAFRLVYIRLSV